jgi:tryptophan-rich sensory protein
MQASVASLVFILFFTIAIVAFLIWKVAKGRNWARITLLVFFLIGVLPFAFTVRSELARSVSLAAVSIAQAVSQAFSLMLVFTNPANEWFRGVSAKTPQS